MIFIQISMISCSSKLPSMRVTRREDLAVQLAEEALTEGDDSITSVLALDVLGKTSKWRTAASRVLNIRQCEEEDFTYYENEDGSRPNDCKSFNERFYKLNSKEALQISIVRSLILRASEENDFEMVWDLMNSQFFAKQLNVLRNNISDEVMECYDQVFLIWLDHCKKIRKRKGKLLAEAVIERFFLLLQKSELYISRKLAAEISDFYGDGRAKITRVFSINNDFSSKCQHCGEVLQKYLLDEETRKKIMQILMDFVTKKHDIYFKTNPLELQHFMSFLSKTDPFDLVVDQPNVSYKPLNKNFLNNNLNKSRNLYETVKHFSDLGWKTLLVCRPEVKKFHHFKKINSLRSVKCIFIFLHYNVAGGSVCSRCRRTQMTTCSCCSPPSTAAHTATS